MKDNKGITLIALVVTIIVLLILAGVSIAMLTGDNGILAQSRKAKTDTANAEVAEKINMELNAFKADILANGAIKSTTWTSAKKNLTGYTFTDGNDAEFTTEPPTSGIVKIKSGTIFGTIDLSDGTIQKAVK
mgnify:CR=1 FL=1